MIKGDINSVVSVRMTGCHRMHSWGVHPWQLEGQSRSILQTLPQHVDETGHSADES